MAKRKRETANDKRLRLHEELVQNRIPKHPRWKDISWVVGYVDSHGAVHAEIVFLGEDRAYHTAMFPNNPRYKTWRWNRSQGMVLSLLCETEPNDEDVAAIHNWLYKNGILNDWEL